MRLVLKSYSQDVNISNPEDASYLLTFIDEQSGREVRLPVQEDTILKLVKETSTLSAKPAEVIEEAEISEPGPRHPEGADIFGEDPEESDVPESEDDIDSL